MAELTIYPTDDTYVYSQEAALPHNVSELSAERKVDVNKHAESYLKFNIPDEDMTIVKLRLWFHKVYVEDRSEPITLFSSIDTSWTEETLTWNNKPPFDGDLDVSFNTPSSSPNWGEIDITGWAQAHRGETVTIIITTEIDYFTAKMDSKEVSNKPQLKITTAEAPPAVVDLTDEVPITDISDVKDGEKMYKIVVPAPNDKLIITTSGGTGDVDIYVKKDSEPTTSVYDYRGYTSGNNESVTIETGAAGTWFIMLRAWADYSGVTLLADYSEPAAPPPEKGYIRGKVTHALLGTPLGIVTVIWGSYNSVTDANGDYVIEIIEGFSQPLTVTFPNFEPYSNPITAGPGDDITHDIALMPTEPPEGWGDWFRAQLLTSFDTAFSILNLVTQPIQDAIITWFASDPSRIEILEPFAEWLGNKFADTYPEWDPYRDGPKGSLTLMALIGLAAGLLGFGSYIQHLRKEVPEGPGMAVWAMIEAEDWVGANAANQVFKDTIAYVADSWFSKLVWLNPITAIFANATKEAQLAQADSYQAIIDANLITEATLIVNSSPSGAKIHIDDVYTFEVTNTTIKVTPGARKLTLKLAGYEDYNENFTVAEDETKTFDVVLTSIIEVKLTINSIPSGAKIYIDDDYTWESTNTTINAPAGLHKITLKLEGYKDHNLPYDWPAGTVKTLEVTLQLLDGGEPTVTQPADEVVIPLEPVGEPTFNSWKVTIRGTDSVTGTDVAAWILIDDVFKGVTTPAVFYLAPESAFNIKLRLSGYRQGEATYTTLPLPAA